MATLMLEAGADVRFIQEMLGHASLESTQIYTQVSIRKLQQIHAATHPSAKRGRFEQEAISASEDHLDARELLAAIADEDEEACETKEPGENA
jgi:integrase/recombinase XerD